LWLVADWVEVGVGLRPFAHVPGPLSGPLEGLSQMPDRVCRAAREALTTGEVVEGLRVVGVRFHDLTTAIGRLGVLPRLVQRGHRRPDLEAARHVRLPRHAAERHDRRARLFGERGPLHTRLDENQCPGAHLPTLTVEFERRAAAEDEVKLLL